MGYLVGTPHFNICYKTPAYPELRNRIYAVCDASFADDRLTRQSHQGHLIFYNSGPIIWKNNRQHTIWDPHNSIEPIRVKLVMKIFDEYANILKGMYSIRCNGRSDHGGISVRPAHGRSDHGDTPACPSWGTTSPLINSLTVS
jgi:hypothetical protein